MGSLLKTLFVSTSLCVGMVAGAVPAKPGLIPFTQPDGSVINVRIHGDEFFNYYTTEDGYYLIQEADQFYYADIDKDGNPVRSDIKAGPAQQRDAAATAYLRGVDKARVIKKLDERAAARTGVMAQTQRLSLPAFAAPEAGGRQRGVGLFPGSHFPAQGKQKALVILVEYDDVPMTLTNAHDYFSRMMNEEGFADYGATGCASEYFREVSNGRFLPEFDVFGPVKLSRNRHYYGQNSPGTNNDMHAADMIAEACELLDDEIDFSQYDRDGDGLVDNVFVFYAGRGAASGGGADTVWPHSWNVEYGIGYRPSFDGVEVSRYACSNEWVNNRPDGVGTFIHEFSHVLGLPDLYATSYTNSFTPGSWSALDYGPYNNDGMTPPLYSAFERYAMGWMEPVPIQRPANITLPSIGSNRAGIVKSTDTEFFLFENRQQTGWDTYIPGHGMLVWHVQYVANIWNSNIVNNTPSHQYVDLEEADGIGSEYSRSGDAFPGTSNVTSFTDDTTPSMKTWDNKRMETPLTEIAETDGVITLKAKGGRTEALASTTALEARDVTDDSFTAAWQPVDEATYLLSVYSIPAGSTDNEESREYLIKGQNVGDVTEYTVTGAQPETKYYYCVQVTDDWEVTEPSNAIGVTTLPTPITKKKVSALDASEITQQGFTANWEALEGATDYLLTVCRMETDGNHHDIQDFTGFTGTMQDGWSSSSVIAYNNDLYAGASTPSIRLSKTANIIKSPDYDDNVYTLSFWHRGNSAGDDDMMRVSAVTPEGQVTVKEIPLCKEKGGVTTTIDFAEEGYPEVSAIRIRFICNSDRGTAGVDDIDVGHGIKYIRTDIEDYTDLPTGDCTSYKVSGLKPGTGYAYTVRATDGESQSLDSDIIFVDTEKEPDNSGVSLTGTATHVDIYDIAGYRVYSGTASDATRGLQPGIYIMRRGNSAHKITVR